MISNCFIAFIRIWYSFSMKRAWTMLSRKTIARIDKKLVTRGS